MSTVSIALCTYNGAPFIATQLESLARQSRLPDEVVVCDDGSTDSTVAQVEEFAKRAPFAMQVHVNEQNLRFAENFLSAAARCSGDLISFCDQDDIWLERKIETSVRYLEQTNASMFTHAATMIDGSGKECGSHFIDTPEGCTDQSELHPWTVFSGFTCTFRRSILSVWPYTSRPIDVIDPTARMSHDRWVTFLALLVEGIYYLPQPLAHYRQHEQAVSLGMRNRSLRHQLTKLRSSYHLHLAKQWLVARDLARIAASWSTPQPADDDRVGASRTRAASSAEYWAEVAHHFESRYRPLTAEHYRERVQQTLCNTVARRRMSQDGAGWLRDAATDLCAAVAGRDPHKIPQPPWMTEM